MLEAHQTVDQNVWSVLNVQVTWLVWERNVGTHVQDHVVLEHSAMLSTTHQCALVQKDTQETPSPIASQDHHHVSSPPVIWIKILIKSYFCFFAFGHECFNELSKSTVWFDRINVSVISISDSKLSYFIPFDTSYLLQALWNLYISVFFFFHN